MYVYAILFVIPSLLITIHFFNYILNGKKLFGKLIFKAFEIMFLILFPFLFLAFFDFNQKNDCCGDSAFFSPEHRMTAYVLILLCVVLYFYCSSRKKITAPVLEIAANCILLTGVILNLVIAIQIKEWYLALSGNIPVVMLFVLMLIKNQNLFIDHMRYENDIPKNTFEKISWQILKLKVFQKIPLLIILSLPALFLLTSVLLVFGQRPDSIIRAFTETYKHGLSQWDYKCDNVMCGGHFLCSIAAKGHKKLVNPTRLGVRNDHFILCNRQLLIANAFEEILEQQFPLVHKMVRSFYNKVGNLIHRYYDVFNNKWVSDFCYILMKPLEWSFLFFLYTCSSNPESRIASQYLSRVERKLLLEKIF